MYVLLLKAQQMNLLGCHRQRYAYSTFGVSSKR